MAGLVGCPLPQNVSERLVEAGLGGVGVVVNTLCEETLAVRNGTNSSFVLLSSYLVFFMQAGFCMLVAGSVRSKNTKNTMLLHIIDPCVCAVLYYCIGYAFAYGSTESANNPFIGQSLFALTPPQLFNGSYDDNNSYAFFLYQYAFASAAATIVIGAVAERASIAGYFAYSTLISGFIYPIVTHWIWSPFGWLSFDNTYRAPLFGSGFLDFAGSGAVHFTGGVAAMWGALLIGPRIGRFNTDGTSNPIPAHSSALIALGTFILWLGWYGFNPGSAIDVVTNYILVGRVTVVMTLSAAAGGITALVVTRLLLGHFDIPATMNGVLAGLVGVTASCAFIEPWAGLICGLTSALVYLGFSLLWEKVRIDDPVDAGPLHGGCGLWGIIFVALLAKPEYVAEFWPRLTNEAVYGLFYGGPNAGKLLAANLVGLLAILAWVSVFIAPLFLALVSARIMRVSPEEETAGLDASKHGGREWREEVDEFETLKTSHGVDPKTSLGVENDDVIGDPHYPAPKATTMTP